MFETSLTSPETCDDDMKWHHLPSAVASCWASVASCAVGWICVVWKPGGGGACMPDGPTGVRPAVPHVGGAWNGNCCTNGSRWLFVVSSVRCCSDAIQWGGSSLLLPSNTHTYGESMWSALYTGVTVVGWQVLQLSTVGCSQKRS